MKILIKGKDELERIARHPFPKGTMLISISDADGEPVRLLNRPDYLLRLAFNDVSETEITRERGIMPTPEERLRAEREYKMFTSEQAVELASFYFQNIENVDFFICQSDKGISRSSAVAAAVMELRGRRGIQIFANDSYRPNKSVFRKTFTALKERAPKKHSV